MKFHRYVTGIALAVGLGCTTAYADSVQFEIVDGVNAVTFDLPESPTPSLVTSNAFYLKNVPVVLDSNGYISNTTDEVDFYDASSGVEFVADQNSYYSFDISTLNTGALFTGSNTDPTFVPGTYTGGSGESVTIMDIIPTPLPSTLPLMIAGLAGIGLLARHRRTNA
jgi:hypothetical protein